MAFRRFLTIPGIRRSFNADEEAEYREIIAGLGQGPITRPRPSNWLAALSSSSECLCIPV